MRKLFVFLTLLAALSVKAQIDRIEPPNWWVGFKDNGLQLLVKGNGISTMTPTINYTGVNIVKVSTGTSPNYLFIDLKIDSTTKAGTMTLVLDQKGEKKIKYNYELKDRVKSSDQYIGFNSSDVIYLITPDRFANSNPENDIIKSFEEKSINRKDDYARHGGDIEGITRHLDYVSDMGFTAIWSCPLLTNNMPEASYHGYAITDFYEIDPRFGSLQDYKTLSAKAKQKGIKLIMDQVVNHCGLEHWWMKDLPFNDWVNYQQEFESGRKITHSNHRRTTNQDLYSAEIDKKQMNDGWFVDSMPDLNQKNPFMARYLIQNSIWWIETVQLGGIRQDTYPYPDKTFMTDWAGAIMQEYPNFSIVGEEWSLNPLLVGYWQTGAKNKDGFESNLRSSMDFPMQNNIVEALKEEESWDKGLVKIYEGLANDFHYTSPKDIVIFPDNHDMDRIHTQLNNDPVLTKMAMAYLLTLPRIPQIYYGTEILMENSDKQGDHGRIRTDFPGGWIGDDVNAFTGKGLSDEQLQMQSYLKALLNYRKSSKAIHHGKTVHFAPKDGIYVLLRVEGDEIVVLILNKNEETRTIDLSKYDEIGIHGVKLKNVISDNELIWKDTITLENKGVLLLTSKL